MNYTVLKMGYCPTRYCLGDYTVPQDIVEKVYVVQRDIVRSFQQILHSTFQNGSQTFKTIFFEIYRQNSIVYSPTHFNLPHVISVHSSQFK